MGKSITHSGRQASSTRPILAEFAVPDLHAQRADGVVDHLGLVGTEEDQVAVLRPVRSMHRGQRSDRAGS